MSTFANSKSGLHANASQVDQFQPKYKPGHYQYDRLEAPILTCNAGSFNNKEKDRDAPNKTNPIRPITPVQSKDREANTHYPKVKSLTQPVRRPGSSSEVTDLSNEHERKGRSEKKADMGRVRSASAGRDKKTEMTSRYWAYLFENLERAFCGIYDTCDKQENILQCKEALLVLENYTRDFNKLIEWLNIKWNYEQTPPPLRPNALSWEIRKPSFSVLPHTRVFEKISAFDDIAIPSENTQTENKIADKKEVTPLDIQPISTETIFSSSHGSPKPVPNDEIPTFPVHTVDTAIQTDLEEDPDIYYFAGGREIASQTDPCEQYGPLLSFSQNVTPVIIVLNTSDSDIETSITDTLESNSVEIDTQNVGKITCPASPTSREVEQDSSGPNIETKSSATQLSEGVIIDESVQESNPQGNTECHKDINKNNTIAEEKVVEIDTPEVVPTMVVKPTTFADKAKNGMLRQAQTQAKSFPGNLNKIGEIQSMTSRGKSGSGSLGFPKGAKGNNVPSINYRSNIASRCRTAMITGQQPQQKSVGNNNPLLLKLGVVRSKSMINPPLQRSANIHHNKNNSQKQSDRFEQTGKDKLHSNGNQGNVTEVKQFQRPHSNSFVSLPDESCSRKRNSIVDEDGWETVRARSNRSKWSPSSSSLYSSSANLSRNSSEKGINDSRSVGSPQSVSPTSKDQPSKVNNTAKKQSPPVSHSVPLSNNTPINYFKSRFYAPSSTISLPVLGTSPYLLEDDDSGDPSSKADPAVTPNETPNKKKTNMSETDNGAITNSPKAKCAKIPPKSSVLHKKSSVAIVSNSKSNKDKGESKGSKEESNNCSSSLATSKSHGGSSSSLSARSMKGSTSTEGTISSKNKVKTPLHKPDSRGKNTKQSPVTTNNKSNLGSMTSKSQSIKAKPPTPVNSESQQKKLKQGITIEESVDLSEEKSEKCKPMETPTGLVDVLCNESNSEPLSSQSCDAKIYILTKDKLRRHDKLQSNPEERQSASEILPEIKSDSNDMSNGNQWKEVDDESSVDDEEIKRKEAALDSAIREEELLEEELRQVEKDFEMIENEGGDQDGQDPDISENASPDIMDINDDPEKELEQFFFISIDNESKVEEFTPREPGRIVTLREKLMSPAKRCDGAETLRKQQAKLANAERNREKLLQSKFNRYVELSERFEALNETTKRLYEERTELIAKAEERRKRAVEKRKQYLKDIVRKAHDEDSKAKEIAFINCLEAQNRRHDYFASAQEIEGRLQTMHEERKLKLEERATKASAVIERQFRIRNGWQGKLESMQEKRRKAEERITREKEERAKERSELAQEKARDREERISALNAAKQAEKEELQKKIIQKQEIHARRHEENMEHIRQKAIELSVPRTQEDNSVPSSVRMCTLCNVTVQSEVQELAHLRGRAHLDAVKKIENLPPTSTLGMENFGLKFITDVQIDKIDNKVQYDKNRYKTLKRQCKKLMQKLSESGEDFEVKDKSLRTEKLRGDPSLKSKMQKNVKEIDRLLAMFNAEKGTPTLATTMDRLMGEIRKNCVRNTCIQEAAVGIGAVKVAQKVLECTASDLPVKVLVSACHLLVGITYQNLSNTLYIFRSTCICAIMDLCVNHWNALIPDGNRWLCGSPIGANEPLPSDPVIEAVMELLFNVINVIPDPFVGIKKEKILSDVEFNDVLMRTQDMIGYLVASGVVDRLSVYCSGVRGPVDSQPSVAELLKVSLDFLTVNIYALSFCWEQRALGTNGHKREPDVTQLLAALESSELAGAVSMSYSLLLYQGAPARPRLTQGCNPNESLKVPPPPGERTSAVVKTTLCLINAVARLDIVALQNVLGSEAVSLQFRHIASQLLWQVVPHRADVNMRRLLNELLIAVGNFTVANKHNQVTIQSGQTPTVLQQLCSLPGEFFTEPKLSKTIIPTLIAATYGCPENREILVQQKIKVELLDTYLHSEAGRLNCVTRRLLPTNSMESNLQGPVSGSSNKKQKKLGKTGSVESDS